MSIIKRLLCKHEYAWYCNIYGDMINHSGGSRSVWQCKKCGKFQFRKELFIGPGSKEYRGGVKL